MPRRGYSEHVDDFQPRRPWCVLDAHANAQPSRVQFRAEMVLHFFDLFWTGWIVSCRTGSGDERIRSLGCLKCPRTREWMAGGRSVIDERVAFAFAQKLSDILSSNFHFEGCRYSIKCFQSIVFGRLPMLVQIDKSRRNHQALCLDNAFSL